MEPHTSPTAPLDVSSVGHSPIASGFSMVDLFLNADWIVQGVMVILLASSVWCWAIIFSKLFRLRALKEKANSFEETFWSGISLDILYERLNGRRDDPLSAIFVAAMGEWKRAMSRGISSHETRKSLQQRIERVMHVTVNREMEDVERHLTFLASVGSTAPFVGLFGTVWGIMHAFQGIAASQSTNLAVVAPGIAEALFATALGLVAAIPAVLAYNKISSDIGRYGNRLDVFSQEFGTLISRQLEGEQ
jgi:biopolymer transport protein TolQ